MNARRITPLLLVAALTLVGCSSSPQEPAREDPESASPAAPRPEPKDVTEQARKVAGDAIEKVLIETDDSNRLQVWTSLADPRGDNGSAVAQQAIEICRTLAAKFSSAAGSVFEADGSTWVVLNHPTYGDDCAEV